MHISNLTKLTIIKSQKEQQASKRVAYKVQAFNNKIIDDYIESVDNNNPIKPTTAMLWAELSVLNKPNVYAKYQKIITSQYTSNDAFYKMLLRNKADAQLNKIVEKEVLRVAKNVDFVESVLRNYEVSFKAYKEMLVEQHNRSVANRRQVIEDVLVQRDIINRTEGLNIPNTYNYRDLDVMTKQLQEEMRSKADYEECKAMNEEAIANGKDAIITKKKWIHTDLGKTTRHQEMGQYPEIDFEDLFQVEDENTGTVDSMLHPRDDNGSPENVYGCVCEIDYY